MLFLYTGDLESAGDVSSVHLILTVRSWTMWFCVQSAQEELLETVHNGTRNRISSEEFVYLLAWLLNCHELHSLKKG